jgi:hypothetical protein
MPDISMCPGTGQTNGKSTSIVDCPKKQTCYRFTARPYEHRQAYFMFLPYDVSSETCEHYMEASESIKKRVADLDGPVADDIIKFLMEMRS